MTIFWITLSILIVIIFILVAVFKSIAAHQRKVESGVESFTGRIGTAKTDINPRGKFYVYGEYWDAETYDEPLKAGEKGRVVEMRSSDEQYLIVEKIEEDEDRLRDLS